MRLFRGILDLIPRRAILPVLSGPLRGARWIVGAHTHGCWIGTYEREVQHVFRQYVLPGMVVYDIGANAGFFSLLAARLVKPDGHVYAFEPLPANLAYLRHHVELNGAANVTVTSFAVGEHDGEQLLACGNGRPFARLHDDGAIVVKVVSLDTATRNFLPPDFVKMDIEGGEHAALLGASGLLARGRTRWLISSHGWRQHDACLAILRAASLNTTEMRDGSADGDYLTLALP